jgi:hypothetical protein
VCVGSARERPSPGIWVSPAMFSLNQKLQPMLLCTWPTAADSVCVCCVTLCGCGCAPQILLRNLTQGWGAAESPIVAFGGSYGGMLAAWMRRYYLDR